jgi:p-cumate 2,3-dioxygenase subunit beta
MTAMTALNTLQVTRQQIEEFLYEEAALLDEWQLEEWLQLLTEDAAYYVPSTDIPDGDHKTTLFLVADDITRLRSRVKQLLGRFAHAEHPHSRTRRMISNVRIRKVEGETLYVTANFVVYRLRMEQMDTYVGRYEYQLVQRDGQLKICERRAILDLNALRPQGKVSIIL